VTVINPSSAADALNITNKSNKDSIIVLANNYVPRFVIV
jgi:hypothetical protein